MRCSRPDVDVADVVRLEMPVEAGLELCAVIGLYHQDAEGQPSNNLVHKADRRSLVAGIVDLEHPDTRAVIDRGELVEALSAPRNPLTGTACGSMRICAWPCGQAQTALLPRPSYDEERRRSRRTEGRGLSLRVQFSTARNVQFSAGVDTFISQSVSARVAQLVLMVARGGIEPPTRGSSIRERRLYGAYQPCT